MADHEQLIHQFITVTGADESRARFFLESANWDQQTAVASFFEDETLDPEIQEIAESPALEENAIPAGRVNPLLHDTRPTATSRFATLATVKNDDGSDSEEEGQAFYAGGSDTSGQQVLGPPKKKQNYVEDLFKSAKEHGAQPVEAAASPTIKGRAFKGTGYRLGETEECSDVVSGPPLDVPPKQVDMVLKLWKNGFSISDGELRDYLDPSNKEFLEAIGRGEVPQELIRLGRGGEVNLNMEDHRHEDFVKPKAAVRAFTGAGHMLGSPAPSLVPSSTVSKAPNGANLSSASSSIQVDDSQPTTSIQIRLADGSKLVVKLNHSHTLQDLRRYIVEQRPQYAATEFTLMTTFPNKELTEEQCSLKEAQLLNAVIVQKLK